MALSKYKKEAEELYNPLREKELASTKKAYKGQAQDTRKLYDTEIFEEGRAYQDQYRENAVQKAINERQVAESIANLGLTDSGLNRTQQTAVQLSAANNKAAIDRQRQSAIDKLNLAKTQDLSTIRQNWLKDKASINQSYDNQIAQTAQELYNKNLEEQTKRIKEGANQGQGIISVKGGTLNRNLQGSLSDNGITPIAIKSDGVVTGYKYTDPTTGATTTFAVGVNPFTGEDSYAKYKAVATSADDFFENGYQPKKVYVDGVNYGYVSDSGIKGVINGNEQRVHKTSDGSLWIWDRNNNEYVSYQPEHAGYTNLKTADWTVDDWDNYFQGVRNKYGKEKAIKLYQEFSEYFIPKEMLRVVGPRVVHGV